MKWYEMIFVLIDMRSFSNLWYWIALAVLWSTTSHWVMGVPYDMITRARRKGGPAMEDLNAIARINAMRLLYISRHAGLWLLAFTSFLLTTLAILAFWQHVEFAQAVFLMLAPMVLIGWLSLRVALKIEEHDLSAEPLVSTLLRHRMVVQLIGMVSIFITSLFGMYQNMAVGGWG
ncbi:component of SufBCD complex [Pseudotabrizicola sp. L79]|uniref:component of SufBCD complex n=1 Tax=Pseudotabrizicola sp. L79 TaxID=3118402 RepID=UPI002F94E415